MATRRRVLMNSDRLFWCSWVKYLSGHSYPEVFAAVEELSEVKVKEVGFLAGTHGNHQRDSGASRVCHHGNEPRVRKNRLVGER